MTPPSTRRRAPAMSAEQRREMIIRTTMPLVAEFGAKVTTAQVARAAGIAEGTIFRVFADKDELLAGCMAEALRPDQVHAEIAAISLDLPLDERLDEAAEALGAYVDRIGAITGALAATGFATGRGAPGTRNEATPDGTAETGTAETGTAETGTAEKTGPNPQDTAAHHGATSPREMSRRDQAMAETARVLAELFEPEAAAGRLRRPPLEVAYAFFGTLTVARRGQFGQPAPSAAEIVDLFLYGALTGEKKS